MGGEMNGGEGKELWGEEEDYGKGWEVSRVEGRVSMERKREVEMG